LNAIPHDEAVLRSTVRDLQSNYASSLASVIAADRFRAVDRIVEDVTSHRPRPPGRFADALGRLSMHPVWGWPVLAGTLYLLYLFVGRLGAGYAVDFFESTLFAGIITPVLEQILRFVLPDGVIETFLLSQAGATEGGSGLLIGDYGLISMGLSYAVAIVLPIVAFFFLAFALMEDSGYLPRLAVMLNRAFGAIGLNGKAVLPLVLGLGCDTMATMTTRVLATRKERLLVTFLLALGIPCSAQLGVILAMMASLSARALTVWAATIVIVIFIAGSIGSRLIPGRRSDFVLEIPPIRRPLLGNVILKTLSRVEWYLREAVPLFLLGTAVLWLLDRLQFIGHLEQTLSPIVVTMLGLPEETTGAFLIGFLRRDYGAAGLYHVFAPALAGGAPSSLIEKQIAVAMVTITLFMPCVANLFMIIKECGARTALTISVLVVTIAVLSGTGLRLLLEAAGW